MCNINFLMKNNVGIINKDIAFLETIAMRSWETNNDGEGYFTPKRFKKSLNKIFFSLENDIIGQPWIALHERFTTHGENRKSNVHPLVQPNVLLLHNGTLDGDEFEDDKKSDSRLLTERINKDVPRYGIVEALTKNFENATGKKSVLVFDRHANELYYYKNYAPNFFVSKGRKQFFASTNRGNCDIASSYFKWKAPVVVESNKLYNITSGDFKPVCDIYSNYASYPISPSTYPTVTTIKPTQSTGVKKENSVTIKTNKDAELQRDWIDEIGVYDDDGRLIRLKE